MLDGFRAAADCQARGDLDGMGRELEHSVRAAVAAALPREPPDPDNTRRRPPPRAAAPPQPPDPAPPPADPDEEALDPRNVHRAEQLALDGQIARAAAALTTTLETPGAALEAARRQLVVGLDPLPVPALPELASPSPTPACDPAVWAEQLTKALAMLPRKRGAGPTGMTNELIHYAVKHAPEIIPLMAQMMPAILASPAAWMSRARAVVTVKTKRGKRKSRTLCVGEALMRWVEKTSLVRWGPSLHASTKHSAVHIKDGAVLTAAVLQGHVARGDLLLSEDAKRAFDSVSHSAIIEALREARADPLFILFVEKSLKDRQYSCARTLVIPPAGRGTAQGTCLGPLLFALVADRAACAAQKEAPEAFVATFLDNLFITARTREELVAARAAALAQWQRDGLEEGEAFTVNCEIEGVPAATGDERILGLGVSGTVTDRYERARKILKRTRQLSAFAELILVRACAIPTLVYDATSADSEDELKRIELEVEEQLAERAGLHGALRRLVFTNVREGGLGCVPLATARDAHILRAGLRGLLERHNVLSNALWGLADAPFGRFPTALNDLLRRAGYVLDGSKHEIHRGGARVMRAPNSLERAAQAIAQGPPPVRPGSAEALPERGRSLAAVALGAECVAKAAMTDGEYRAVVWLHTGAPEPVPPGVVDGRCPLCAHPLEEQGHHRWCRSAGGELSSLHHSLAEGIVQWLAEAPGIRADTEHELVGDGKKVRADAVAYCPQLGSITVEVKTREMRCPTSRKAGVTIEGVTPALMNSIEEHYRPNPVVPLIVTAAGAGTRRGALDALAQLQAMRETVAPELADSVSLRAWLGQICAANEWGSYEAWRKAVEAHTVAKAVTRPRAGEVPLAPPAPECDADEGTERAARAAPAEPSRLSAESQVGAVGRAGSPPQPPLPPAAGDGSRAAGSVPPCATTPQQAGAATRGDGTPRPLPPPAAPGRAAAGRWTQVGSGGCAARGGHNGLANSARFRANAAQMPPARSAPAGTQCGGLARGDATQRGAPRVHGGFHRRQTARERGAARRGRGPW